MKPPATPRRSASRSNYGRTTSTGSGFSHPAARPCQRKFLRSCSLSRGQVGPPFLPAFDIRLAVHGRYGGLHSVVVPVVRDVSS